MKKAFELVTRFHEKYGSNISSEPKLPEGPFLVPLVYRADGSKVQPRPTTERQLRIDLITEEFTELMQAEEHNDLVEIADALADIIYVALGTAISYGIPLDHVFYEVHASNMTKEGKVGPNTKVKKGDDFIEPDIKAVLYDNKRWHQGPYPDDIEHIDCFTMEDIGILVDSIQDLMDRCNTCQEEKKLFGPSWVCSPCNKIRNTHVG